MLNKLLSGRFILTIITGLVFAYCCYVNKLTAEAIAAIIATVFTSYFNRADRKKEE